MGAWIEIPEAVDSILAAMQSLPLWERGLKLLKGYGMKIASLVAPFMGAWIEMVSRITSSSFSSVAPFMGAWIEIMPVEAPPPPAKSLPLWERGLKFKSGIFGSRPGGRSLYGSVD